MIQVIINEAQYNKIIKENYKEYSYIGQCDVVRRKCESNEEYWHEMMNNKVEIPFETFVENVDMSPILDEDVTPENYYTESMMSDPETKTYQSN